MERSIRYLQFSGGLCIAAFCKRFGIKHPFVSEYIMYQLDALRVGNLPDWEQRGTQLHISGRGDPLPKEISELMSERIRVEFEQLIETTSEIGLIDMYGQNSGRPALFFQKSCGILSRMDVDLPFSKVDLRIEILPWGDRIDEKEFQNLMASYHDVLAVLQ